MHLIVDPGKVSNSGTLTDSTELVVDGTVAQAHPALVGADVRSGDAAQVSANGGDDEHLGGASVGKNVDILLVEMASLGERVGLSDLAESEAADEDELTVPGGLHDLARRQLTDVDLLVGVSDVPGPRDHLVVDNGDDSLEAEHITG